MALKRSVVTAMLAVAPSLAAAQLNGLGEPGDIVDDAVDEMDGVIDDVGGVDEEPSDEDGDSGNAGGSNVDGGPSGGGNGGVGNGGGGNAEGGAGAGFPLLDPRTTETIGPGTPQVCFYALPNFEGESLCLHAGNGLMPLLGDWASRISSIQVIGQALALVCDSTNLMGTCQIVTESMPIVSTPIFSIQVL